uniref:ATP synthase complex subunit 8 n=1 Tax=Tenebrionoidea sp. 4 KM-2017 TaxID=2219482 RepID=A0A346RJH6_9CUCU|nr:ATP synthase F0 subunit 8 [Tenebrionoidea sp. 4 KM-2017]
MPQMAPMSWSLLMIYFILIFMIFNLTIYFSFYLEPKKLSSDNKIIQKNWKW